MKEPNPLNPRLAGQRWREHGEKRFSFTYSDIALAAGLSARTVRSAAAKKRDGSPGELDPKSLASVIAFVTSRKGSTQ